MESDKTGTAMATGPVSSDVQAKIEQIGRAICRVYASDGFAWIRTTNFDDPTLQGNKDKAGKITIPSSVVWAAPSRDQTKPDTPDTFTECFNNGSPDKQQSTFSWAHKTTRSFTWSMTETLSTALESYVEAEVPEVAKAGVKWSVSLSLSSTQSSTQGDEQDWNISQPMTVDPKSALKCTAIITKTLYNVPFTVPVNYKGYVAVMTTKAFPDTRGYNPDVPPYPEGTIPLTYNSVVPLVVLVPIGSFLKFGKEQGIDINFTYLGQDSATINLTGVCTGAQGIDYNVDMEEVPLNGCGKTDKVTELG